MNELKIFNSPIFGNVRVAELNGDPIFCLADVCYALGLRQGDVRQRLEDGVVSTQPILDSLGREQMANFVNEDGLYDVILDSRKAEAKQFRKWVTSEVLPAIRKTGSYSVPQFEIPTTLSGALMLAAKQAEKLEKQAVLLLEQAPKVEFYDEIIDSKTDIDMGHAAKTLNVGIGRNKLFEILRNKSVLMRDNVPFQKYVDMGWFRCVEVKYVRTNGDIHINIKTLVLQKGLDGIRKLIK